MVDVTASRTPMQPRQSGEIQNLGRHDQPQNTSEALDVEFVVVSENGKTVAKTADFGDFLNQSQQITELKAKKDQGLQYDPVRDIEQRSALLSSSTADGSPI